MLRTGERLPWGGIDGICVNSYISILCAKPDIDDLCELTHTLRGR